MHPNNQSNLKETALSALLDDVMGDFPLCLHKNKQMLKTCGLF